MLLQKRHSFLHKFSNYKVQGEKGLSLTFLIRNEPKSKVTDAIHKDGSNILRFYPFSSELLFSLGLLKNQMESVAHLLSWEMKRLSFHSFHRGQH